MPKHLTAVGNRIAEVLVDSLMLKEGTWNEGNSGSIDSTARQQRSMQSVTHHWNEAGMAIMLVKYSTTVVLLS
jgi:hypothetical protein